MRDNRKGYQMNKLEREVWEIILDYADAKGISVKDAMRKLSGRSITITKPKEYQYWVDFYERHKKEIWELVLKKAERLAYDNHFKYLATGEDADYVNTDESFRWFMGVNAFKTILFDIENMLFLSDDEEEEKVVRYE